MLSEMAKSLLCERESRDFFGKKMKPIELKNQLWRLCMDSHTSRVLVAPSDSKSPG